MQRWGDQEFKSSLDYSEFEPGWDTWNLSLREADIKTKTKETDHSIQLEFSHEHLVSELLERTSSSLIFEEPSLRNCYTEQLDEAAFQRRVTGLHHSDKTVESSSGRRDREKEGSHVPHPTVYKSHYPPQGNSSPLFSTPPMFSSILSKHLITYLKLDFIWNYSALSGEWSVIAVLSMLNVWVCSVCS